MTFTDWLSVFAILISLVSLGIVFYDRQEMCKVTLKLGKCEQFVSDDDGYLYSGFVPGVEISVRNIGKPTFFIEQLTLHSSHLPDGNIVLQPKRKSINPGGSITVDWHRSIKTSLSLNELAHALTLDPSKSEEIKFWIEMETESGRHIRSKTLYMQSEQFLQ